MLHMGFTDSVLYILCSQEPHGVDASHLLPDAQEYRAAPSQSNILHPELRNRDRLAVGGSCWRQQRQASTEVAAPVAEVHRRTHWGTEAAPRWEVRLS